MIGVDQLRTGSRLLEVTAGLACGLAARTSQEKQFSASGARLRDAFMRDCLEGKISPLTARGEREPGDLPSRLYESCERVAEQRAIMEVNAHYKFIDDCMVGRVP